MRTISRCSLPAMFVILGALPCAAQGHAVLERGFAAGKAYQVGDIDSINLFNGGLGLQIQLGKPYNVGEAFSYSLALTYSPLGSGICTVMTTCTAILASVPTKAVAPTMTLTPTPG